MPIDHTDPTDVPGWPHPPDSHRSPDAIPASPSDAADRIAAHRAYRAQAEQVYRAAAG